MIISDRQREKFIFNPPFNLSYTVKGFGVNSNIYNGIREWNNSGVIHDGKNIFNYELPFYVTEGEHLNFCVYYEDIPFLFEINSTGRTRRKETSFRKIIFSLSSFNI